LVTWFVVKEGDNSESENQKAQDPIHLYTVVTYILSNFSLHAEK